LADFDISIDTHGLDRKLLELQRRGIQRALRSGIAKATREERAAAVGYADAGAAAVGPTKVRTRGGNPKGTVRARYPYNFLASGTQQRTTRSGANRGFVVADPFMQRAANTIDPRVDDIINAEIHDSLRRAGLV
jgi:hypothetical protein